MSLGKLLTYPFGVSKVGSICKMRRTVSIEHDDWLFSKHSTQTLERPIMIAFSCLTVICLDKVLNQLSQLNLRKVSVFWTRSFLGFNRWVEVVSVCLSACLSVSLTHTLFPFAWMRNSISLSSTGSHLELMRQTSLRTLQLTEREGTLGK